MNRTILILILFLPATLRAASKIRITTPDKCIISAYYAKPSSGAYVFINIHGLGSDKGEWSLFQKKLEREGFGYLSLDLRGHGESRRCKGRKTDYRDFSAEEWEATSEDAKAAAAFLRGRGIKWKNIVLCGASVGSSIALKAGAEMKGKVKKFILLSPGINYAGIRTDKIVPRLKGSFLLMAASPEDRYAWDSSGILLKTSRDSGVKSVFLAGPGGHGVNMFARDSSFAEKMLKILDE